MEASARAGEKRCRPAPTAAHVVVHFDIDYFFAQVRGARHGAGAGILRGRLSGDDAGRSRSARTRRCGGGRSECSRTWRWPR